MEYGEQKQENKNISSYIQSWQLNNRSDAGKKIPRLSEGQSGDLVF